MLLDAKNMDYTQLNNSLAQQTDCEIENCLGQRFLGAGMSGKQIRIHGIPGNALGAYLNGADITVYGNAQDAVGDTMNAGRIVIHGNVGDAAGYAMRGGKIFVKGNAGYRTGIHMKAYHEKHPVLVIGGRAGSFLGEYLAGGTVVGRIADQKAKFAKEQPYYPDAPKDIVSAADLIRQQQEILARNGEKQRLIHEHDRILGQLEETERQIEETKKKLHELMTLQKETELKLKASERSPEELEMESTEELERNIADVDEINRKVRANLDKDKAEEDAHQYAQQYVDMTNQLEAVRKQKRELLDHADLPLPELTVSDGALLYKGQRWDNMSGSDRLIVATSIVRRLNPECGFVLMDKLEQMDLKTLKTFGAWLEEQGLQVIATRVSTGEECSIIIEDGYGSMPEAQAPAPARAWKKGEF